MTTTISPSQEAATEAFVGRVFESVLGTMDTWSIYLGDKLGFYDALNGSSGLTRDELASETNTNWRYVNEWLEHQVTTGFLDVDDASMEAAERRYTLPPAHTEVLCDRESLNFLTPFVRLVTAGGIQLPAILEAYRNGGGVGWEQYGDDMRTGQAEMNRPWFMSALGSEWFPSVPKLQAKLQTIDCHVADIGCGEGWSSIAIAKSYPEVTVDGYDIDAASVIAAREHAAAHGVADRVRFHRVDGASLDAGRKYDVVTLFECVHDMPYPTQVLKAVREIVKEDGVVVVMDEAVGTHFGEKTDEVERVMYGFSMFVCLPDGMSHEGSAGTGTVMRPDVLRQYANESGFSDISILPIENDLWRFYQLHQ
ncbi:MAG: class I SAM-dependent methyltransferase [Acidimicrobiia bacterium]